MFIGPSVETVTFEEANLSELLISPSFPPGQKNSKFKFPSPDSDCDEDPFKIKKSKVKKAAYSSRRSPPWSRNPGSGNPKMIKMKNLIRPRRSPMLWIGISKADKTD